MLLEEMSVSVRASVGVCWRVCGCVSVVYVCVSVCVSVCVRVCEGVCVTNPALTEVCRTCELEAATV